MDTPTTNGRVAAPPPSQFQEVKEGLALLERMRKHLPELEQAERDTEVRLIVLRNMIADYREQLTQAAHAATIGSSFHPPTPGKEQP